MATIDKLMEEHTACATTPPIEIDVTVEKPQCDDSDDEFVEAPTEPMADTSTPLWSPDDDLVHVNGSAVFDGEGHIMRAHQHVHYRGAAAARHESLDSAVRDLSELDVDIDEDITMCFPALAEHAKERTGAMMKKTWAYACRVTHFHALPEWLQDNDFLYSGHRLPTASFSHCFRSIFAIHTETGNIWTHLLGCVAFVGVAIWFLSRPSTEVQWEDKLVFSAFFAGAILCLGMSSAFHTVSCHSHSVTKLFSKLDYCGISLLIVGSFIPWLYYGFYCRLAPKLVYMIVMCVLGAGAIGVSVWDKFAEPQYRPVRALTFVAMGLSAIVPFIHFWITDGTQALLRDASVHWMIIMGLLYISGAAFYAARIPERWFPGKCDIWFQSHQVFHVLVVVAAFIHYHGIVEMATNRLSSGSCSEQLEKRWPDVYA